MRYWSAVIFFVLCLVLGIRLMLASENEFALFIFILWTIRKEVIFFKCLVEISYKAIRAWAFIVWVVFDFPSSTVVKNWPDNAGDSRDTGSIPEWEDPLEKEMSTHPSILACKIPCTEEYGRLQTMGLQNVRHNWTCTAYGFSLLIPYLVIGSFRLHITSVQFSCSVVSDSLRSHRLQYARLPCTSPTPGPYSNSCPSGRWCYPTISSSVPFSSRLQSFPASGSFQMSQFFASGGQSIGVSASASVLPMNIQDWFPLDGLVGSPCSPRDSQESSSTPQFKSINSLALGLKSG